MVDTSELRAAAGLVVPVGVGLGSLREDTPNRNSLTLPPSAAAPGTPEEVSEWPAEWPGELEAAVHKDEQQPESGSGQIEIAAHMEAVPAELGCCVMPVEVAVRKGPPQPMPAGPGRSERTVEAAGHKELLGQGQEHLLRRAQLGL